MINRRNFIRTSVVGGVGCLVSKGCGKKKEDEEEGSSSEIFVPKVNNPPFPESDYFIGKGVSEADGDVDIVKKSGHPSSRFNIRDRTNYLQGCEVFLHENRTIPRKSIDRFVMVTDPSKNHLPTLVALEDYEISNSNNLRDANYTDLLRMPISLTPADMFSKAAPNLFMEQITSGLPSWNAERVNAYPGRVYLGDWSFNQVDTLVTNLKYASLVLAVIPPTSIAGLRAYKILSTTDTVLDQIANVADYMSQSTGIHFDRDETFSMYYLSPFSETPGMVISFEPYPEERNIDVKDLFPLEVGNTWTYKYGWAQSSVKVLEEELVNGKWLGSIQNMGGIKEYYGFSGKNFNFYGFTSPSTGRVLFNPPVLMGNDTIQKRSAYLSPNSEVVFVDDGSASGQINETLEYEKFGTMKVLGKPYGDCWKCTETYDLVLRKNGKTQTDNGVARHWFAKNVGKIKTSFNDYEFELQDFSLDKSIDRNYSFSSLVRPPSLNSLTRNIIDAHSKV